MIRLVAAFLVLFPLTALADKTEPGGDYLGVVTSIDGPFVAKWTVDRMSLSVDGGKTFVGVLSGRGNLTAAAIDRDGTLYAVRGDALGVRSPDGAERWTKLPENTYWDAFAAAGKNVVLLSSVSLVSRDGGKTFSERRAWDVGNFQTSLALQADGTIDYLTGHEAACGGGGQNRWHGNIADDTLTSGDWEMDAPISARPSMSAYAYALDSACTGDHFSGPDTLCAQGKQLVAVKLDGPADLGDADLWTRPLGAKTLMLAGKALVMVEGTRGHVLSNTSPTESIASFSGTARDAWVVSAGHVFHFDGRSWVMQ